MLQANVPAWFEIPTLDLDRAQQFYERLLGVELKRAPYGEGEQAIFPGGCPPLASGALVHGTGAAPSVATGSLVYLAVEDIRPLLARVAEVGGAILQPLAAVPGTPVVYAHIRDCEGNRVGLASGEPAADAAA